MDRKEKGAEAPFFNEIQLLEFLSAAHFAIGAIFDGAGHCFSALAISLALLCCGRVLLVLFIKGKLDGIASSLGAQVVHACLQSFFPTVEVHRGELLEVGVFHEDIERL